MSCPILDLTDPARMNPALSIDCTCKGCLFNNYSI